MKKLVNTFLAMADPEYLRKHTQELYRLELPQTSPANAEAADYVWKLLQEEGFEAEKLVFPGDGKTEYQDKIMPLCWNATKGKLTVLSDWEGDRVIADYEKEPFALIRYSMSTPKDGMQLRVVTWEAMQAGEDVHDALILLPEKQFPTDTALVPVLKAGAVGLINGAMVGADVDPDATHWANNCTQTNSWFVNADEAPFLGYCVTPNMRNRLEEACRRGEVRVLAESDSIRYVGDFNCVTGLLPGESSRELWILAHLAEPLENDDSSGVVGAINILRNLRKAAENGSIPKLKYSVRVLFGAEVYGFAAMAEHFGGYLRERCIGAISMDSLAIAADQPVMRINFAPQAVPFYGNAVFEGVARAMNEITLMPPYFQSWGQHYGDDACLSDATVGLPTMMPTSARRFFWHSSHQRPGYIDYEQFARLIALYSAFAAGTAAPDAERLNSFIPLAEAYAEERLAQLAAQKPLRAGTSGRERLDFWAKKEAARLMDFTVAGVRTDLLKQACDQLFVFATNLNPIEADEKTEDTPHYDAAGNLILARDTRGFPHDLARVPLEKRWNTTIGNLIYTPLACITSNMDGKKTLQQLCREAEWEERCIIPDNTLGAYREALLLLVPYGYFHIVK